MEAKIYIVLLQYNVTSSSILVTIMIEDLNLLPINVCIQYRINISGKSEVNISESFEILGEMTVLR